MDMTAYANKVLQAHMVKEDPMTRFIKNHCTGTIYDSCVNSPCRYSSSSGCAHPLHPKNFDAYEEEARLIEKEADALQEMRA